MRRLANAKMKSDLARFTLERFVIIPKIREKVLIEDIRNARKKINVTFYGKYLQYADFIERTSETAMIIFNCDGEFG